MKMFYKIDILLVDFKIEFGRYQSDKKIKVILADEISPDSCRLWDMKSNEKLDKDRFRRNLGGLIEAYKEVATRLGIDLSSI
jgi:phosphoribosylaminoimidazole-succinocarboxamide synthase